MVNNTTQLVILSQTLNNLIVDFVQGNADVQAAATNTLTSNNYYTTMATSLNSLQLSSTMYPDYEIVRNHVGSSLQNLVFSMQLNNTLSTTQSDLFALQEMISHPRSLVEYLQSLGHNHQQHQLLPETSVTTIVAEIDPSILRYIQLYGMPPNGVFDPIKLGAVIAAATTA